MDTYRKHSKSLTGITGLDEITNGGLPKNRTTLVYGSAGCGKTLLGIEFLMNGITQYNENAVFISFEESISDLEENVRSLGFDLKKFVKQKKLVIDHIELGHGKFKSEGNYDLEGLIIRINNAIKKVNAKRLVIDTIEVLFSKFSDTDHIRGEIHRIFQLLKKKDVTTIITGERGEGEKTRSGLEEYVADCVIFLDHRVIDQLSIRRLRVVKYRGSHHETNEYPYLISSSGISVNPITSSGLNYKVQKSRISTGIQDLDLILNKKGFFTGSSVLVTGQAGSGKSSIAASFARQSAHDGKKVIYFAFEESEYQIIRNMKSINIDLAKYSKKGLLKFFVSRPTAYGLEKHLSIMQKGIDDFKPEVVIIDPFSNFLQIGTTVDIKLMLTRLLDYIKSKGITSFITSLESSKFKTSKRILEVSSFVDTWINITNEADNRIVKHLINIVKSRGMKHSKEFMEIVMSSKGIALKKMNN